jgi:hypothetical protein
MTLGLAPSTAPVLKQGRPQRELNPPLKTAPEPEKLATEPLRPGEESPRLTTVRDHSDHSRQLAGRKPRKADLEAAIATRTRYPGSMSLREP